MAKTLKRRLIREKVLQILFASEMNPSSRELVTEELFEEIKETANREFALNLINLVLSHQKEADDLIKKKVSNWDFNRIALIDRILLRMGICELLYIADIPPKVTINESIEIAKEFSTSGSGKFINGILDAIMADMKRENKLAKKGRGLFDESISKTEKSK